MHSLKIASVFAGIWAMSLHEPLPDHSSLSRIRARYGLDVFRRFYDLVEEQCLQAKLVWGKELYIDSSAGSMRMRI
jgi:hypothetical protein